MKHFLAIILFLVHPAFMGCNAKDAEKKPSQTFVHGQSNSLNINSSSQESLPEWTYTFSQNSVKAGDEIELIFTAKLKPGWHLYSTVIEIDPGPMPMVFNFSPHASYKLIGGIKPVGEKNIYEKDWEASLKQFSGKAEFRQKIKILSANPVIKGELEGQQCTEGICIPVEADFEFKGLTVTKVADAVADPDKTVLANNDKTISGTDSQTVITPNASTVVDPDTAEPDKKKLKKKLDHEEKSMISFMLWAFVGGLFAVATPCVFPMLPMTVTFFTKKSETKGLALSRAFGFGFSIILIYTSIGFVFGLFGLGLDFGNWLSTHWVPNVLFFLIFMIFGAAFLGMFELTLPSGMVNKIDQQSNMRTFAGLFFMSFTLVLVSFSCTGPIVGTLLIEAIDGQFQKPMLGMLAFSTAIALPFTLFAIFPSWLSSLPKSGGWLNSVKVVLGFLEIALAFKFLSIPDQVYHWNILDRDIFIAIWIVVFVLLGFYLLGKLRFHHDSPLEYISVPRLFLAMASFTFVVYLIPGLFGAPLKALSGYLPPLATVEFPIYTKNDALAAGNTYSSDHGSFPPSVKYGEFLHLPHGLKGFFDLKEAKEYSKKVNKPIFIDFTGHGCVNCREMEANVWADPEVLKRLKEDFVMVALYVDEKLELPEAEWYISPLDNKVKKTIGKQNFDLQKRLVNQGAQPYYVIIDSDENILTEPVAYDRDVDNFIKFLEAGKAEFQNTKTGS